jgi:hypothetical protein
LLVQSVLFRHQALDMAEHRLISRLIRHGDFSFRSRSTDVRGKSRYLSQGACSVCAAQAEPFWKPRLEHDPEKWVPVFGKGSCSNNKLKRDDD